MGLRIWTAERLCLLVCIISAGQSLILTVTGYKRT